MDASQVGICEIPDNAWCDGVTPTAGHRFAVVLLLEHGRLRVDNLARGN